MLLFFHTGMLFVGWGWHITNAETIPGLQLPMDLAHRLRMPLLFVIAGAGMWFALQRRSGTAFAGERTLRLLVPAIVGMFLIVPPQVFIERLADGRMARRLPGLHTRSACSSSSPIRPAISAGTTSGSSSIYTCTCCCCCR